MSSRSSLVGLLFWGEAPKRLYDFDGGAGPLSLNIWLHEYARRAAGYHVNKVKRHRSAVQLFLGAKSRD
jgi:hypothetical protein